MTPVVREPEDVERSMIKRPFGTERACEGRWRHPPVRSWCHRGIFFAAARSEIEQRYSQRRKIKATSAFVRRETTKVKRTGSTPAIPVDQATTVHLKPNQDLPPAQSRAVLPGNNLFIILGWAQ